MASTEPKTNPTATELAGIEAGLDALDVVTVPGRTPLGQTFVNKIRTTNQVPSTEDVLALVRACGVTL